MELLPRWRARKIKDTTRRDVRALVETIAERAPITANRTLALIRKMFNYAIGADWIEAKRGLVDSEARARAIARSRADRG